MSNVCFIPCAKKLIESNSHNINSGPGSCWSCLRKRRYYTWRGYIDDYARGCPNIFEECDIAIIETFLRDSMHYKIRDWLLMSSGNRHRFKHRSKFWSWEDKREEEFFTCACHEAAHVLAHWFSCSPKLVKYASIVTSKTATGHVAMHLPKHECITRDILFSDMCCFIGGGIGEMMLAYDANVDKTFNSMSRDLAIVACQNYVLAKDIMEFVGATDPAALKELMEFLLQKSFTVTRNILKSHFRELKAVSYALFAERKLYFFGLSDILGRRPLKDKTLFEEFVMDDISSGQFKTEPLIVDTICSKPSSSEIRIEMRDVEGEPKSEELFLVYSVLTKFVRKVKDSQDGSLEDKTDDSLDDKAEGSREGSLEDKTEGSQEDKAEDSREGSLEDKTEGSLGDKAEGSREDKAEGSREDKAEGSREDIAKEKEDVREDTAKYKGVDTEDTENCKDCGLEGKDVNGEDIAKDKDVNQENTAKDKGDISRIKNSGLENTEEEKEVNREDTVKNKEAGREDTARRKKGGLEDIAEEKVVNQDDNAKDKEAGREDTAKGNEGSGEDKAKDNFEATRKNTEIIREDKGEKLRGKRKFFFF